MYMYVCMCVCVKVEYRKQRMMQQVFQIQEIFNSLNKRIPVTEVSRKSLNMEPKYLTKCVVFEVSLGLIPLILIVSSKESLI